MDRQQLYDQMANRKHQPRDLEPYLGGNGRVDRCVELFKRGDLPKGGCILDVGGGIGDLAYAVTKLNPFFSWAAVVDISQKNLDACQAKSGASGILADIDKEGIPSVDEQYDVVTALDFIEHIVDPESFAREVYRVLKIGGEVFINTPNIQFFQHIDQLIQGRFPHTSGDREVYHGGHLAFFTFLDLVEIFGNAGFDHFRQFKDEEGYVNPPSDVIKKLNPVTQQEYINACMRFGNPNLLFAARKPD